MVNGRQYLFFDKSLVTMVKTSYIIIDHIQSVKQVFPKHVDRHDIAIVLQIHKILR